MDSAAQRGHLDVLIFLHYIGAKHSRFISYTTDFKTLQWLDSIGIKLNVNNLNRCIRQNLLETAKWLHSIGIQFNNNSLADSIRPGNLELCKWIYSERPKLPKNVDLISYLNLESHLLDSLLNPSDTSL